MESRLKAGFAKLEKKERMIRKYEHNLQGLENRLSEARGNVEERMNNIMTASHAHADVHNEMVTSLEQITRDLECSICWLLLSQPQTFARGHVFCEDCIEDTFQTIREVASEAGDEYHLQCPACRAYLEEDEEGSASARVPVLNATLQHIPIEVEQKPAALRMASPGGKV